MQGTGDERLHSLMFHAETMTCLDKSNTRQLACGCVSSSLIPRLSPQVTESWVGSGNEAVSSTSPDIG